MDVKGFFAFKVFLALTHMKSDLDLLIEHLEKEVELLKHSMKEAASELFFQEAEYFRNAFFHTNRKLIVLKSLKFKHFSKIISLESRIKQGSSFNQGESFSFLGEEFSEKLKKNLAELKARKVEYAENELQRLREISPKGKIDNDQILNLLDDLIASKTHQLSINLEKKHIKILIFTSHKELIMQLESLGMKSSWDHRQMYNASLLKLGFILPTYQKSYSLHFDFKSEIVLLDLSILFFEIFQLYDEIIDVHFEAE